LGDWAPVAVLWLRPHDNTLFAHLSSIRNATTYSQDAEIYVEAELVWSGDSQMELHAIRYITRDELGLLLSPQQRTNCVTDGGDRQQAILNTGPSLSEVIFTMGNNNSHESPRTVAFESEFWPNAGRSAGNVAGGASAVGVGTLIKYAWEEATKPSLPPPPPPKKSFLERIFDD